jgi:hypothetical protein
VLADPVHHTYPLIGVAMAAIILAGLIGVLMILL